MSFINWWRYWSGRMWCINHAVDLAKPVFSFLETEMSFTQIYSREEDMFGEILYHRPHIAVSVDYELREEEFLISFQYIANSEKLDEICARAIGKPQPISYTPQPPHPITPEQQYEFMYGKRIYLQTLMYLQHPDIIKEYDEILHQYKYSDRICYQLEGQARMIRMVLDDLLAYNEDEYMALFTKAVELELQRSADYYPDNR